MAKQKKRKPKKLRSIVMLGMILTRRGGPMKDRRSARGGAKNDQRELVAQAYD